MAKADPGRSPDARTSNGGGPHNETFSFVAPFDFDGIGYYCAPSMCQSNRTDGSFVARRTTFDQLPPHTYEYGSATLGQNFTLHHRASSMRITAVLHIDFANTSAVYLARGALATVEVFGIATRSDAWGGWSQWEIIAQSGDCTNWECSGGDYPEQVQELEIAVSWDVRPSFAGEDSITPGDFTIVTGASVKVSTHGPDTTLRPVTGASASVMGTLRELRVDTQRAPGRG